MRMQRRSHCRAKNTASPNHVVITFVSFYGDAQHPSEFLDFSQAFTVKQGSVSGYRSLEPRCLRTVLQEFVEMFIEQRLSSTHEDHVGICSKECLRLVDDAFCHWQWHCFSIKSDLFLVVTMDAIQIAGAVRVYSNEHGAIKLFNLNDKSALHSYYRNCPHINAKIVLTLSVLNHNLPEK